MSLLQHAPTLTVAEAQHLVRELYELAGAASPLPSERDQNFRIETNDGAFVLKIANATEDRKILEAQNAAMMAVASHTAICPAVRPSIRGELIELGGGHFVRLLTWLPGAPLASFRHHSMLLLEDLGRRVAELDVALAGFDHPAVHRRFPWDLVGAVEVIQNHLPHVLDRDLRALVEAVLQRDGDRSERISALPQSVIHNDPNDHNVLVIGGDRPAARDQRVSGIIDFGDMVHSVSIADLAVAIAYGVLDKDDPLHVAMAIVRGYHGVRAVSESERAMLWPLVRLRLCLSVCMAGHQQNQRPEDAYLAISQGPIKRTLPRLVETSDADAGDAFRSACAQVDALGKRRALIGGNVSVAYDEPLTLVRGEMQYVFDKSGRRYLDGYNNVPHVGHSHPRVVEAAAAQMRLLNTNTRYLHDSLLSFAERLTSTLPSTLRVCYFLNSGSEANELALRLARTHTWHRDLIVLDSAYHGNTTTLIDVSPHKFNGPGGQGEASWVHVVPVPDVYRGPYKKDDDSAAERYAACVGDIVARLTASGKGLCGFLAETCPSVGGQIVFPAGYLQAVYRLVRAAGGVCIADEVQTAYGRMGTSFYAFEDQGVVPDIVVLGKPMGNGYPLAAVITTEEIAASFDNGMEFFSTFGGSTVSCAVGLAVLDVVQSLELQRHALGVGEHLLARLRPLVDRFSLVGDVRGSGLFIGVELIRDRETLTPAASEATHIVNRMREEGVLIGTDGPFQNVLKIRPPMPFDAKDADVLVDVLEIVLNEM